MTSIVITTLNGNFILDRRFKTHDGWVAGVDFMQASYDEKAVSATAIPKKNINDLHVKLGHPLEAVTQSTAKTFGIQFTGTFMPCEDFSKNGVKVILSMDVCFCSLQTWCIIQIDSLK